MERGRPQLARMFVHTSRSLFRFGRPSPKRPAKNVSPPQSLPVSLTRRAARYRLRRRIDSAPFSSPTAGKASRSVPRDCRRWPTVAVANLVTNGALAKSRVAAVDVDHARRTWPLGPIGEAERDVAHAFRIVLVHVRGRERDHVDLSAIRMIEPPRQHVAGIRAKHAQQPNQFHGAFAAIRACARHGVLLGN
jgi:hypothetical protein